MAKIVQNRYPNHLWHLPKYFCLPLCGAGVRCASQTHLCSSPSLPSAAGMSRSITPPSVRSLAARVGAAGVLSWVSGRPSAWGWEWCWRAVWARGTAAGLGAQGWLCVPLQSPCHRLLEAVGTAGLAVSLLQCPGPDPPSDPSRLQITSSPTQPSGSQFLF